MLVHYISDRDLVVNVLIEGNGCRKQDTQVNFFILLYLTLTVRLFSPLCGFLQRTTRKREREMLRTSFCSCQFT